MGWKELAEHEKPIPDFRTDAEAEYLVDMADLTEYDLSGFKPFRFELQAKSAQLNMRLPEALLEAIKQCATIAGIPYTKLVRDILEQYVVRASTPPIANEQSYRDPTLAPLNPAPKLPEVLERAIAAIKRRDFPNAIVHLHELNEPESKIVVGNLEMDKASHAFLVDGQPFNLPSRSAALLALLVQRKGQVITKDALLLSLYSADADLPEPKIIDVFVAKVRSKLAEAGATCRISTVWGVGYAIPNDQSMTAFDEAGNVIPLRKKAAAG